jgi:hypothetical protein
MATSTCGSGFVCERYGTAACLDPNWAEWPMPNCSTDVTAGAPNAASYTDNGDGTITDGVTGLMWTKAAYTTSTLSATQAVAHCTSISVGGHSDWRLPSLIELVSIVDYGKLSPAINGAFTGVGSTGVYLSSTVMGPGGLAGGVVGTVSFVDGTIMGQFGNGYAFCVR